MSEPRITESGERRLVGSSGPASFVDGSIPELWRAFRPQVRGIGNRLNGDFISMRIYDQPLTDAPAPDVPFAYWAAVEVEDFSAVPEALETTTIPNGLYAVFEHRGTADDFARTAEHIFVRWLPSAPYRLAPRPFFEVLGPGYRPDDPDALEHVWIPVEGEGR